MDGEHALDGLRKDGYQHAMRIAKPPDAERAELPQFTHTQNSYDSIPS